MRHIRTFLKEASNASVRPGAQHSSQAIERRESDVKRSLGIAAVQVAVGGRPVVAADRGSRQLGRDRRGAPEFSTSPRDAAAIPPTIPSAIAAIATPLVHARPTNAARSGPAPRPHAIAASIARWRRSAASASVRQSCRAWPGRPTLVMALRPIDAGAANIIMRQVAGMQAQCHATVPQSVSDPPQRAVSAGGSPNQRSSRSPSGSAAAPTNNRCRFSAPIPWTATPRKAGPQRHGPEPLSSRPRRNATISAMIESAISSGPIAPRSSPAGARKAARRSASTPRCRQRSFQRLRLQAAADESDVAARRSRAPPSAPPRRRGSGSRRRYSARLLGRRGAHSRRCAGRPRANAPAPRAGRRR